MYKTRSINSNFINRSLRNDYFFHFSSESTVVLMNVHKSGGYISQRLEDNSPILSTERNSIDFMFLTEAKDGLIFYMGQDKDYLLVQIVHGSMRVRANFGKGKLFYNLVREGKGLFTTS